MGPHTPSHEPDGDAREHHERVAEDGLAAERRDDLTDDAEARQHHDVHLGVAEDPEQVLPQQRITTVRSVEEVRMEPPVEHQQEQRHGDDGDREEQEELRDQRHPGEDRELEPGHARRPKVEHGDDDDGDDQVDRGHQRGDAGDLQPDRVEVDAVAR